MRKEIVLMHKRTRERERRDYVRGNDETLMVISDSLYLSIAAYKCDGVLHRTNSIPRRNFEVSNFRGGRSKLGLSFSPHNF